MLNLLYQLSIQEHDLVLFADSCPFVSSRPRIELLCVLRALCGKKCLCSSFHLKLLSAIAAAIRTFAAAADRPFILAVVLTTWWRSSRFPPIFCALAHTSFAIRRRSLAFPPRFSAHCGDNFLISANLLHARYHKH
jgi:hypothetical protein